jgi:hypothetical protein
MVLTVQSPRLRTQIRECRDWRSARGYAKANIQTVLEGTTDLAGVSLGTARSFVPFDSTERTAILATVTA